MAEYTWTSAKPTETGWYWQRHVNDHGLTRVVEVYSIDGVLRAFGWSGAGFAPMGEHNDKFWAWAGPIPSPEEAP